MQSIPAAVNVASDDVALQAIIDERRNALGIEPAAKPVINGINAVLQRLEKIPLPSREQLERRHRME